MLEAGIRTTHLCSWRRALNRQQNLPYLLLESSWISKEMQCRVFSSLKWPTAVTRLIMTHVYTSKGWKLDFLSCQGWKLLRNKLGLRYTLWVQVPETGIWLKILLGLDLRVLTAFPWLHLSNILPKSVSQLLQSWSCSCTAHKDNFSLGSLLLNLMLDVVVYGLICR